MARPKGARRGARWGATRAAVGPMAAAAARSLGRRWQQRSGAVLNAGEVERVREIVDRLLRDEGLDVDRVRNRLLRRFGRRAAIGGLLEGTLTSVVPLTDLLPVKPLRLEAQRITLWACLLYLDDPHFFERRDWSTRLTRALAGAAKPTPTGGGLAQTAREVAAQVRPAHARVVSWPRLQRQLARRSVRAGGPAVTVLQRVARLGIVQGIGEGAYRYLRLRNEVHRAYGDADTSLGGG